MSFLPSNHPTPHTTHTISSTSHLLASAVLCYLPAQIYQLEHAWFEHSQSFGLMQQAAWQMANYLTKQLRFNLASPTVLVVVGSGNNGGDGWMLAKYLTQLWPHWQVQVLQVAAPSTVDAKRAQRLFDGEIMIFEQWAVATQRGLPYHIDMIVDALFGIGLDRKPSGNYQTVIEWVNHYKRQFKQCQVVSIDVPSGLNATTGAVYDKVAIQADISLCLIARKAGLHLQDSKDYVGKIIDLPLVPVALDNQKLTPTLYHHCILPTIAKRPHNSYKGSYGHVLVIGGNRLNTGINQGQGMAGASLLTASTTFATGVGKVTVACHSDFHPAIITALPDAMTADLHHIDSVNALIGQVDVVVLGMGFGRDETSFDLFDSYLATTLAQDKTCVIDADGLYHLPNISDYRLIDLKNSQCCYFTPHSGEAARLLGIDYRQVDQDKLAAIAQLQAKFGGTWLIKGATTLVHEHGLLHSCGLGNAGMATAGMGDCLSGVVAGLLAQQLILGLDYPLLSAVLIHAQAGDRLAQQVGEYALSANAMSKAIGNVMQALNLS